MKLTITIPPAKIQPPSAALDGRGVPKRLAEARARRAAERATTNEVTVVVTGGAAK